MKRKVVSSRSVKDVFSKVMKSRITYIGLASILGVTYIGNLINDAIGNVKAYPENTHGYSTVVMSNFISNQSNTFTLLDAGDYNTKGAFFFDTKIDYCYERGMSVGVVINETETNYDAIHRDVDLAKSIVEKHEGKIDLPIFFNVDSIIESYDLTSDEKTNLIMTFLSKCESNGMFVCLYGKDVNLVRFKSVCENVVNYNCCIVCDNKEGTIKYDGPCNFVKYPNGTIKAKEDFSKYVIGGSFNTTKKFVTDSVYTVSKGEDILDIAFKFNITARDLLEFNDMRRGDIEEGVVLRIPSVLGKYAPYQQGEDKVLDEPLVGADISNHQMNASYNPDKLAENFDFIILKATEGASWTDKSFDVIAKDCIDRDIPIGAYALSTITDTSLSETEIRERAEKQTEHFLNTIANKKIEYPVYLDLEGDSESMILNAPEKFRIILEVWYQKITDAGYTPGLYMNKSMYNSMVNSSVINSSDFDVNSNFEMWIAGSREYYLSENKNGKYKSTTFSIEDVKPNGNPGYDMVQPTNVGDGKEYGAANSWGKIDINFSYVDYTEVELPEGVDYEILAIKDPNQLPDATRVGLGAGGFAILLAGGLLIHRKVKKRRL